MGPKAFYFLLTMLSWKDSVRYCGMIEGSVTAKSLCKKIKKGRRLSVKEVNLVEKFGSRMYEFIGDQSREVNIMGVEFPVIPYPELLIQSDKAEIVRRGSWLVDTVSERCVAKVKQCGGSAVIFPNPVILVNDLANLLLCLSSSSPCYSSE